MKQPLVSVIVPTKNSATFLRECLRSIRAQTYKNVELIIVDNFSTDKTASIAKKIADKIYSMGPERSAQVNFGVAKSKGEYVYKVDSDFVLDKRVIEDCVAEIRKGYDAIVVHNSPDSSISWIAKIRKFEVTMYKYDLSHSSARFVRRDVYKKIGGFNSRITAGEDYDFQNKLNRAGYRTGFIDSEALHRGEPIKFWPHMKKYYDYGRDFVNYKSENALESKVQLSFFRSVYIKHWSNFIRHPIQAFNFIIYNFCKYLAGGLGMLTIKARAKKLL
jgi:glycosyltransferase involved in cell wall biosynthesis